MGSDFTSDIVANNALRQPGVEPLAGFSYELPARVSSSFLAYSEASLV